MEVLTAVEQKHRLPELPYPHAALEPYIDARTMQLHHGEHHARHVEELNGALAPFPDLRSKSALWLLLNLRKLPAEIRVAVRASAGGHVNHGLLWQAMSPTGGGVPQGLLGDAIYYFPGYGGDKLRHVSWEDWFDTFDKRNLTLVYQETKKDGSQSNFSRLTGSDRDDG